MEILLKFLNPNMSVAKVSMVPLDDSTLDAELASMINAKVCFNGLTL